MKRNYLITGSTKAATLYGDEGWTVIGGDEERKGIDAYFSAVPWLYRGVKAKAKDVSHMPFAVYNGEDEVVSSANWKQDAGKEFDFMPNPRALLDQIEQSLTMAAKAFLFIEGNRYGIVKKLKYCAPSTITPNYDKVTGELLNYERAINGRKFPVPVDQIIAIYDADYAVEMGGGTSQAAAALMASGVLFNADKFVAGYFEKGAIKATILSADTTDKQEAERLASWWKDVVGGIKNAWSAIVLRAKQAVATVIGEGLEGLQNNELTKEKRQDIATALGIPESRMWSAAANYATRQEDELTYYRNTIVPDCDLIAEAINEQLFTDRWNLGQYRWEFQPETLDVFQADETDRAQALSQLVTALADPIAEIGMDILGYELSEETLTKLQALWKDKQERADKLQEQMQNKPAQGQPPQLQPGEKRPAQDEPKPPTAQETRSALFQWRKCCLTSVKQGDSAAVSFENPAIPARVIESLLFELEEAKTKEDVNHLFDKAAKDCKEPEDALVVELRMARELLASVGNAN